MVSSALRTKPPASPSKALLLVSAAAPSPTLSVSSTARASGDRRIGSRPVVAGLSRKA